MGTAMIRRLVELEEEAGGLATARPVDRLLLVFLLYHANDESGRCDPGEALLLREVGLTNASTLRRSMRALEGVGLVRRELGARRVFTFPMLAAADPVAALRPAVEAAAAASAPRKAKATKAARAGVAARATCPAGGGLPSPLPSVESKGGGLPSPPDQEAGANGGGLPSPPPSEESKGRGLPSPPPEGDTVEGGLASPGGEGSQAREERAPGPPITPEPHLEPREGARGARRPAGDPLAAFPVLAAAFPRLLQLLQEAHPYATTTPERVRAMRKELADAARLDGLLESDIVGALRWLFESDHRDAEFWRQNVQSFARLRRSKVTGDQGKLQKILNAWARAESKRERTLGEEFGLAPANATPRPTRQPREASRWTMGKEFDIEPDTTGPRPDPILDLLDYHDTPREGTHG